MNNDGNNGPIDFSQLFDQVNNTDSNSMPNDNNQMVQPMNNVQANPQMNNVQQDNNIMGNMQSDYNPLNSFQENGNQEGQMPYNNMTPLANQGNGMVQNGFETNATGKNNTVMYIGIGVGGALVLIIILAILLSGSKKTLTCTLHRDMMGVVYDSTVEYTIKKGSATVKSTMHYDLEKITVINDKDKWAQEQIDSLKDSKSDKDCKYDYKYSKGKYFEMIANCSSKFLEDNSSQPFKDKSVDDLYKYLKDTMEGPNSEGYTCK